MNNTNENKNQKESRGQRIARHYEEMNAKKQLRLLRNEYARFLVKACNGDMAAANLGRRAYGFEIDKTFYNGFYEKTLPCVQQDMFALKALEQKEQRKLAFMELLGKRACQK